MSYTYNKQTKTGVSGHQNRASWPTKAHNSRVRCGTVSSSRLHRSAVRKLNQERAEKRHGFKAERARKRYEDMLAGLQAKHKNVKDALKAAVTGRLPVESSPKPQQIPVVKPGVLDRIKKFFKRRVW